MYVVIGHCPAISGCERFFFCYKSGTLSINGHSIDCCNWNAFFVNLIVKNINKKIQVTHLTFNKENKKSIGRGFNPNFFLPNL